MFFALWTLGIAGIALMGLSGDNYRGAPIQSRVVSMVALLILWNFGMGLIYTFLWS